jgi:hypothetical protein
MTSDFPERVYTEDEVEQARNLVQAGHKHQLIIEGSPRFKGEVEQALKHVKTAGCYEFLRTYIKQIVEIDGFSQLRESDVAIWANLHLLTNLVEAAGFFIQKAWQMKEFLEGKLYYGGAAEARSIEKNLKFLRTLKSKSNDDSVKTECDRLLKRWADSTFVF